MGLGSKPSNIENKYSPEATQPALPFIAKEELDDKPRYQDINVGGVINITSYSIRIVAQYAI